MDLLHTCSHVSLNDKKISQLCYHMSVAMMLSLPVDDGGCGGGNFMALGNFQVSMDCGLLIVRAPLLLQAAFAPPSEWLWNVYVKSKNMEMRTVTGERVVPKYDPTTGREP